MTETIEQTNANANKWKSETFATELSYIKDPNYRGFAEWLIEKLPDYFFEVAASSTGKYHPAYTNGKGGLVRHVKAAVRIAHELIRIEMYDCLKPSHDAILIALLLHDGFKHGYPNEDGTYNTYTVAEHSKVCADWLNSLGTMYPSAQQTLSYIANLVLTHMGQWNMDFRTGKYFAPKPQTVEQCFVHMCDYLASRKCLEFNESIEFVDPY